MMRKIQRAILITGVPMLFLLAAACTPGSPPLPTAVPPSPTPLPLPGPMSAVSISSMGISSSSGAPELSGASLYQLSCAACHGADRAGSTLSKDGQRIDVPPLAWDDLNSMYSTDPSRGSVTDQLALAITKGQDEAGDEISTVMPRWSLLSQGQVSSLVEFLQSPGSANVAPPSTAETSLQGEQLYQAACAACHGPDRAGQTLSKDGQSIDVPALGWNDLNTMYSAQPSRGTVEQQLALAITKGQDEEGDAMSTVMPRWSFLSAAQVDSLIQYVKTGSTAASMMPGSMPPAVPTNSMPMTNTEITGVSLFQLSCAACHGADRAGNTFDQDGQKISVPALTWDDLNSMYSADASRGSVADQLSLAITKGQDESGDEMNAMMPRWSSLSQGQVDSLVQFIQTGGTASGELTGPAADLQGEQLYQTACAACHGSNGAGKTLEMDGNKIDTPALSWSDLSSMYATDSSRGSVEDQVALAITKGLDEEGNDFGAMMPRWSFLSQAQVKSLIAYLRDSFK